MSEAFDVDEVIDRQRAVADGLAMIALQELWARMPWDAEIHLPGGAVAKLKQLCAPKARRSEGEDGSAMPPRFGFDLIIPSGSGFGIDHVEFYVKMTGQGGGLPSAEAVELVVAESAGGGA